MAKKKHKKKSAARRKRPFRILSLDGGGIRGIITARWLGELEDQLKTKSLRDHFDLIAGTSTGSILACAVASGLSAEEIEKLYKEYGREVFPAPASRRWNRFTRLIDQGISAPKYDDAGLERVLRRQFGDMTIGELPDGPLLLVPTYNTLTREATVIKSNAEKYQKLPLWELAKASNSAPTFFPAHVVGIDGVASPLVDGGVAANNPTACAIAEAIRVTGEQGKPVKLDDVVVASFGTGSLTRPITIKEATEWGAVEWAIPVIDVLMDGAADTTHYVASKLLKDGNYFRFQTKLKKGFDDMDDASETNLNGLLSTADQYLDEGPGQGSKPGKTLIKELVKELVKELKA
ncbi:MAG: patatin-like phospholipase family protein [Planctomycetota bacterium]